MYYYQGIHALKRIYMAFFSFFRTHFILQLILSFQLISGSLLN